MANFRGFVKSSMPRFFSASSGSVVIVVAVLLFLIVGVLMVTVDLSRVQSGASNNQAAIDAAALGAAEYASRFRVMQGNQGLPTDLQDYAKKVLIQNLMNDQNDATMATDSANDFQVTTTPSSVTVTACLNVSTGFASALGNGGVHKVCSSSSASLPGAGNVEIVFALDVSHSMLDTYPAPGGPVAKLSALRDSVKSVMDFYAGNPSIYWGVVPYTGMVDLGANAPNIVLQDFTSGQPSDDTQPDTIRALWIANSPPTTFQYKIDGREDYLMEGTGSVFYEPFYGQPFAMLQLGRVPLTSRETDIDHPENTTSAAFNDDPPTPGNMFLGYWHQPYDYFMEYDSVQPNDSNATNGTCGECFNFPVSTSTTVDPGNNPIVFGTCLDTPYNQCADPNADHTGCGTGGNPTGPGGGINE